MATQNKANERHNRGDAMARQAVRRRTAGIRVIIMTAMHQVLSKVSCCNSQTDFSTAAGKYSDDATSRQRKRDISQPRREWQRDQERHSNTAANTNATR